MQIKKEKLLYLLICGIMDFFFSGGLATVIGKQDIYTFLGVFICIYLVHNGLWSWVKNFRLDL